MSTIVWSTVPLSQHATTVPSYGYHTTTVPLRAMKNEMPVLKEHTLAKEVRNLKKSKVDLNRNIEKELVHMETLSGNSFLEDTDLGADADTWKRWGSIQERLMEMHTNNDFPLAHVNGAKFLLTLMELKCIQQEQQQRQQQQKQENGQLDEESEEEERKKNLEKCWELLTTDAMTLHSSLTHLVTALKVAYQLRDLQKIDAAMKWTMKKIFGSDSGASISATKVRSSKTGQMVTVPSVPMNDVFGAFMVAPHIGRWSDFLRLGNILRDKFSNGPNAMTAIHYGALSNPFELIDYHHMHNMIKEIPQVSLCDTHLNSSEELEPQEYNVSDVRLLHLEMEQDLGINHDAMTQEPILTQSQIDEHVYNDPSIVYTPEELDEEEPTEMKWAVVDHEMPSLVLSGLAGMWYLRSANFPLGCAVVKNEQDGEIQTIYMKGSREYEPGEAEHDAYDNGGEELQGIKDEDMQDNEVIAHEKEREKVLDESKHAKKLFFSDFVLHRETPEDPTRFTGTHKRGMTLLMPDGSRSTTVNTYKIVACIKRSAIYEDGETLFSEKKE